MVMDKYRLLNQNANSTVLGIDISGYSKGIYTAKIATEKHEISKKIIKE
ncbi:T9SS C-terminal target domain-containing protein [Chryseobacterium piperi]|nr:T9SS C-terminal target domain-containing protein [Chryseobacterium piperi]